MPALDCRRLEKLREGKLEKLARSKRDASAESLRAGAVTVSHDSRPIAAVGATSWITSC